MKHTKEELDKLYNDPLVRGLANMFGVNLNDIIEQEKKAIDEEMEQIKTFYDNITNVLDDMVKEGTIKCEEKTENGVTKKYYYPVEETEEKVEETTNTDEVCEAEEKKEYVKPEATERRFLMTAEQLDDFINTYSALIEAEKRLSYLYGMEFNEGDSGFGFPSKINEIIWNFVRIIFGDDNAEDIADYIFGNSNFDNVKSLYDELV